jgi:hypothetical protein
METWQSPVDMKAVGAIERHRVQLESIEWNVDYKSRSKNEKLS